MSELNHYGCLTQDYIPLTIKKLCERKILHFLWIFDESQKFSLYTNALTNGSTFNTDEAKAMKVFPTFG